VVNTTQKKFGGLAAPPNPELWDDITAKALSSVNDSKCTNVAWGKRVWHHGKGLKETNPALQRDKLTYATYSNTFVCIDKNYPRQMQTDFGVMAGVSYYPPDIKKKAAQGNTWYTLGCGGYKREWHHYNFHRAGAMRAEIAYCKGGKNGPCNTWDNARCNGNRQWPGLPAQCPADCGTGEKCLQECDDKGGSDANRKKWQQTFETYFPSLARYGGPGWSQRTKMCHERFCVPSVWKPSLPKLQYADAEASSCCPPPHKNMHPCGEFGSKLARNNGHECYRSLYGTTKQCESDFQVKIFKCAGCNCKNARGHLEFVRVEIAHSLQSEDEGCKPWFVLMDAGIRNLVSRARASAMMDAIEQCKSELGLASHVHGGS